MPLVRFSSHDAVRNLLRSRACLYPDDRIGGERLSQVARLSFEPSFGFSKSDRVLIVGCCFARELEKRLIELGFDVPIVLAEGNPDKVENGLLSKFNVRSMEQELAWAVGHPAPAPEKLFLQVADGLWQDPQLVTRLSPMTLERAKTQRGRIQAAFAQMASCRVVILTLGTAEAWFDNETGLYLNIPPPQAAKRREPTRFSLDLLSYDEILGSLERIHAILSKAGHPDFKMLVTVSPVPFKATFTGEDALSANSYDKAVQRAAAQAFSFQHENVDYFPGFEIVTLSDRRLVYETDNKHVSPQVIAHIMDTVLAAYAPDLGMTIGDVTAPASRAADAPVSIHGLFARAKIQLSTGDAVGALASCRELFALGPDSRMLAAASGIFAVALANTGEFEEAATYWERAERAQPSNAIYPYKRSGVLVKLGRSDEALDALRRAVKIDSVDPLYSKALAKLTRHLESSSKPVLESRPPANVRPWHDRLGALLRFRDLREGR